MKSLIIVPLTILLVGCSCLQPKPCEPVVTHQLVYKKIPQELLEIPGIPASPASATTQKEVSLWLIENEKRTKLLEDQLKKIKEYNDKE